MNNALKYTGVHEHLGSVDAMLIEGLLDLVLEESFGTRSGLFGNEGSVTIKNNKPSKPPKSEKPSYPPQFWGDGTPIPNEPDETP